MLLIHNKIYMSSYIAFALFSLLVFYSNTDLVAQFDFSQQQASV